jgi:hypothetical protein
LCGAAEDKVEGTSGDGDAWRGTASLELIAARRALTRRLRDANGEVRSGLLNVPKGALADPLAHRIALNQLVEALRRRTSLVKAEKSSTLAGYDLTFRRTIKKTKIGTFLHKCRSILTAGAVATASSTATVLAPLTTTSTAAHAALVPLVAALVADDAALEAHHRCPCLCHLCGCGGDGGTCCPREYRAGCRCEGGC